jgi:hypothetical protein
VHLLQDGRVVEERRKRCFGVFLVRCELTLH